jgi:hypothetical protein
MELTGQQRYEAMRRQFSHRIEGQVALQLFDSQHPNAAQRTLANLHVVFLAQEPNIRRAMTRANVFPGMAAAATSSDDNSVFNLPGSSPHSSMQQLLDNTAAMNIASPPAEQQQLPASPLYSETQMHEFAFRAVAAAMQSNPTAAGMNNLQAIGQRYCHIHGYGTHTGTQCKHNRAGNPCRYRKYDSRNGPNFDATRVIGHVNCRHTPKCISAANAKSATGPLTYPDTPGNEQVYSGPG